MQPSTAIPIKTRKARHPHAQIPRFGPGRSPGGNQEGLEIVLGQFLRQNALTFLGNFTHSH